MNLYHTIYFIIHKFILLPPLSYFPSRMVPTAFLFLICRFPSPPPSLSLSSFSLPPSVSMSLSSLSLAPSLSVFQLSVLVNQCVSIYGIMDFICTSSYLQWDFVAKIVPNYGSGHEINNKAIRYSDVYPCFILLTQYLVAFHTVIYKL